MFGSMNAIFALIADITQCFWRCETAHRVAAVQRPLVMATSCTDAVTLGQKPSHHNIDCWPWPPVPQTQRLSFLCARRRHDVGVLMLHYQVQSNSPGGATSNSKMSKLAHYRHVHYRSIHWPLMCEKNCIIIFRSLLDIRENVEGLVFDSTCIITTERNEYCFRPPQWPYSHLTFPLLRSANIRVINPYRPTAGNYMESVCPF